MAVFAYVSVHLNIQHYWKNVQSLVICMKKAAREVMNFLGFDILFDAVVEKEYYPPEFI